MKKTTKVLCPDCRHRWEMHRYGCNVRSGSPQRCKCRREDERPRCKDEKHDWIAGQAVFGCKHCPAALRPAAECDTGR